VTGCCQVTTTLPDRAAAEQLAATLVGERLVACAQVFGPASSTYWWKENVEQASEWYCQMKTTMPMLPALKQRIRELHPYEVPELLAVPVLDGDERYLKWIEGSVCRQ
jgi:periplasmic divalent cation tolerance protein